MRRISRSWDLVKMSWGVLRADKELAVFPFFSAIATTGVIVAMIVLYFITGGESLDEDWGVFEYAFLFLIYFFTALVGTFFNAALIGAALIRLRGGNPTVSDGLSIALSRTGPIVGYSVISATIGTISAWVRSRDDTAGNVGSGILDVAWGIMTFLVVPVLVAERIGPIDALKRSASLLKRTWGEQIAGGTAIRLLSFLVALPVALVGGFLVYSAASAGSAGLTLALTIGLLLALALIGISFSAMNAIYKAALYVYAADQMISPYFGDVILKEAFIRNS